MQKLLKEFTYKTFRYKQLERTKTKAIYEQHLREDDMLINYEVIKVRERKPTEIGGVKYPHMEIYPGSSEWGVYGWTFKDLKDANIKYENLK